MSSATNTLSFLSLGTGLTLSSLSTPYYVGFGGSSGSTFTLPAASLNEGVGFLVKNKGSATLVLDATGFGGIYGTSLVNTWSLVAGEATHLVSDGTNWVVVGFASGIVIP